MRVAISIRARTSAGTSFSKRLYILFLLPLHMADAIQTGLEPRLRAPAPIAEPEDTPFGVILHASTAMEQMLLIGEAWLGLV
jgi:hypothetical protein